MQTFRFYLAEYYMFYYYNNQELGARKQSYNTTLLQII